MHFCRCGILTFDPAQKMLFQDDAPEGSDTFQWPVIERNRVGGLRLIIWDKVKVPLCHYRVMHRKRVTSELHDSYFRLMTIKNSILKIEWASNDYITQLSSTSSWVEFEFQASWRGDVIRKATPGRGGPREPRWSLGSREDADKMWQITQQSEPLGLRLSIKRTRKTQRDGHKNEGSKYCSYIRSPAPSPTQTLNNPFEPLQ